MSGRGDGWLVKCDFINHSGSSDPNLDSESKLEPSVALKAGDDLGQAQMNDEVVVKVRS